MSMRILQLLIPAVFSASVATLSGPHAACAADDQAVLFVGKMHETSRVQLFLPHGVAVDELDNVYVADTSNSRIVKFDSDGDLIKTFGSVGFGPGQLYYPDAVSIGKLPGGGAGVYVADTQNHRVSVFTPGGTFIRTFGIDNGDYGPLRYPAGIATLSDGGGVFVADAANNRSIRFSVKGQPLQSFDCSECPNGNIRGPAGIAIRESDKGLLVYLSDSGGHQVHILDSFGHHIRSFGSDGPGTGTLGQIDDIAVDQDDGSVYVADPTFNDSDPRFEKERVSKFSATGDFLFSFDSTRGDASDASVHFQQPQGVGLDKHGNIYVADTGNSDVYKFRLAKPALDVRPVFADHWGQHGYARFFVRYNGVERACAVRGRATLTVPAQSGGSNVFTVSGEEDGVGTDPVSLDMDLTKQQSNWIENAKRGTTKVHVSLVGKCEGLRLTATDDFVV